MSRKAPRWPVGYQTAKIASVDNTRGVAPARRLSFPILSALLLALANIHGWGTNALIFHAAGFNFADFADLGDFIVAGFKMPLSLAWFICACMFAGIYFWFAPVGIKSVWVYILIGVPIAAYTIAIVLAVHLSSVAAGMKYSRSTETYWKDFFTGRASTVQIALTRQNRFMDVIDAKEIRLLAEAGDIYLLSVDGNAIVLPKADVSALKAVVRD